MDQRSWPAGLDQPRPSRRQPPWRSVRGRGRERRRPRGGRLLRRGRPLHRAERCRDQGSTGRATRSASSPDCPRPATVRAGPRASGRPVWWPSAATGWRSRWARRPASTPTSISPSAPTATAGCWRRTRTRGAGRVVADLTAVEAADDPDGEGYDSNPTDLAPFRGGYVVTDAGGQRRPCDRHQGPGRPNRRGPPGAVSRESRQLLRRRRPRLGADRGWSGGRAARSTSAPCPGSWPTSPRSHRSSASSRAGARSSPSTPAPARSVSSPET